MLFTTLFTTLFVFAQSRPLAPRDVYVPPVVYPKSDTVWRVGETHTVVWDASNPPQQITNPKGRIFLRKGGYTLMNSTSHRLQRYHRGGSDFIDLVTLASGFDIVPEEGDYGRQTIQVPDVAPGTDYAVVRE